MTIETLHKAKEITERIKNLESAKANINDERFYNKNRRGLPEDVLAAGKSAMLAVIDEAIDSAQRELDAL